MGLSSSQARLLNLTSRMHDIEYKAQKLEAQKLQMANESTAVYKEYEDALNKQKIQFKSIGSDGTATYKDASIKTLIDAGYKIKVLNGNTWSDTALDASNKLITYSYASAIDISALVTTPATAAVGDVVTNGANKYSVTEINSSGKPIKASLMTANTATIDATSVSTLSSMVEAGFIVFEKPETDGTYTETNVATDTNLQEVSDETSLKKAEAKYEASMAKIDAKDKKFDTDLAAMDNERTAIKTEIDTLKSVAKDNIDRTFKLFS